jgi:hypothetical protein
MTKVAVTLVACLLLVGAAQAERILFDFGPVNGPTTSPDSLGRYWNNQTAAYDYLDLSLHTIVGPNGVDAAGNAITGLEVSHLKCAGTGASGVVDSTLYPSTAQKDFIFVDGTINLTYANAMSVCIAGLDQAAYDLTLFGSRASTNRTCTLKVNGVEQVYDAAQNTSRVVTWTNVPVGDVTIGGVVKHNAILIEGWSTNGQYDYIGVADLTSVPEPATIGLLVVGAIGVLSRRRK